MGDVVVATGWLMRYPGEHWRPGRVARVVGVTPPPPFDCELEDRHGERCYVSACEITLYGEAKRERIS